jgi:hypothetical protein
MAGTLHLSEEAKMRHARADYTRIQDVAGVIEFIKKVAADHQEELPQLEANLSTLVTWLEDRYMTRGCVPIPKDEPVFVLRAKDITAPQAVLYWADLAYSAGASAEMVKAAREHANMMVKWQLAHKPQVPDMPPQGPCICCGANTHILQGGAFICSPECAGG